MTYQVLARKWRPRSFEQLTGQEHVSRALIHGLDQDRLHHAFLFTGTRGVGKTTIARILAKCLNCEAGVSSSPCGECPSCGDIDDGRFVDMLEVDAASRTGVDDMRELLESVQYTPTRGRFKVYIIDEVHMLSQSSFNALLKTLEEPPPHVKFVLATTDPEKIPVTILSRCLRFNLRRLLPEQIENALAQIAEAEEIEFERAALTAIARAADGSMRDGLSLLDQSISYGNGKLVKSDVVQMLGLVEHEYVVDLLEAAVRGQGERMLGIIEELASESCNPSTVLENLAEVAHRVCLVHSVPGYRDEERTDWESIAGLAAAMSAQTAQLYYQIAIKGAADLGLAPDPRTGLEMTMLRMLSFTLEQPARSGSTPSASGKEGASSGQGVKKAAGAGKVAATAEKAQASAETGPASDTNSPAQPPEDEISDRHWVSMVSELAISGQVRELARNVHLRSAGTEQWDFVISPSLSHLGTSNCVDQLGEAISERLGRAVRVSVEDNPGEKLITAATMNERHNRKKKTQAAKAIENDPTVVALKERLGATILEDSIQPLQ